MKIEKTEYSYQVTECDLKFGEQITLDGEFLIPMSTLDKIRAEIEAIEDGISSYHNDRPWIFKDEALAIIDKYKTEMESEE